MATVPESLTYPRCAAENDCLLTEEMIEAARAELRETDGEPLDSPWHRANINLLIEAILWHRRGRTDYFVGGNMFIYYGRTQARKGPYKGPDFFFVEGVDGSRERPYWWVFDEGGRYPDAIIELISPTTEKEDKTNKKEIYEKTFRTPEYFWYDPDKKEFAGWRLQDGKKYQTITPNEKGWLWSEQLGLWIGAWEGSYQEKHAIWVRFFDSQGQLVLTGKEYESRRAEAEKQRADEEKQRAESLQAELKKLQALLIEKGIQP